MRQVVSCISFYHGVQYRLEGYRTMLQLAAALAPPHAHTCSLAALVRVLMELPPATTAVGGELHEAVRWGGGLHGAVRWGGDLHGAVRWGGSCVRGSQVGDGAVRWGGAEVICVGVMEWSGVGGRVGGVGVME